MSFTRYKFTSFMDDMVHINTRLTYHSEEQDIKGKCKCHNENRKDQQNLDQGLQNLQEHYDINAEEVEPEKALKAIKGNHTNKKTYHNDCMPATG